MAVRHVQLLTYMFVYGALFHWLLNAQRTVMPGYIAQRSRVYKIRYSLLDSAALLAGLLMCDLVAAVVVRLDALEAAVGTPFLSVNAFT